MVYCIRDGLVQNIEDEAQQERHFFEMTSSEAELIATSSGLRGLAAGEG
jgi:hypothetical protein